ncbi:MAG: CDP-diacylglycerol--serine O-phosphatidyltransferase [Planctomycetaceae bacterium]|jgi:CDP-diacylglycerol---serine O-phosphatidyltransferase|nr:CDP-diacylglycerol--serine O-phosphatidyltransferase [Planctomycetaceae bacterium]
MNNVELLNDADQTEESEDSRFPIYPTLMTLGNAICGLIAIGFSTKFLGVLAEAEGYRALDSEYYQWLQWAGMLIFLGMLFDTLDGQVARWTNQVSRFGLHLDSLCDVITFGVAPAFIMLSFSEVLPSRFIQGIAGIYTLCAIMRLARYNVEAETEGGVGDFFRGLPSPAAAGAIATFAIAMPDLMALVNSTEPQQQKIGIFIYDVSMVLVPLLTFALACLMVSRVPYPHLGKQLASRSKSRKNFVRLVQILFAIVGILMLKELALPVIFLYYLCASPCTTFWNKITKHRRRSSSDEVA